MTVQFLSGLQKMWNRIVRKAVDPSLYETSRPQKSVTTLIYAIGDVHGRYDLLKRLLVLIKKDMVASKSSEIEKIIIVFLGDYIDRGHQSKDVIETLSQLELKSVELVFLKGNHEAAILDFIENPSTGASWTKFGGRETLSSYGVDIPNSIDTIKDWEGYQRTMIANMPRHHLSFLYDLQSYKIIDEYMFVHAGVDPAVPVQSQTDNEYLWIRDAFLKSMKKLPFIIVHGHTPEPKPVWDGRRIGIDTGAYISNKLTAARLLAGEVVFLST